MRAAQNTWSVKTLDDKTTLLTTDAIIELKGGLFGRLFQPLVRIVSARMGNQALAAFKYLVEENRPFEGPSSSLPTPSPVC